MANSYITKKALGEALKYLLNENTLSHIGIREICDRCHLCRKSFYYHFEDKYALVNWIFDDEFLVGASEKEPADIWAATEELCGYFYTNRVFYRRIFRDGDGNFFTEHLRKTVCDFMTDSLAKNRGSGDNDGIAVIFYADAFCSSLKRWLLEKEPCSPADFVESLRRAVIFAATELCRR